jgi:hypothetical protein
MENTISRGAGRIALDADKSALRNTGRSAINQLKLVMLWLAVILPLLWGAMDAVRDVRRLFP